MVWFKPVWLFSFILIQRIKKTLFSFAYFDLTKQKMDIKDGTTKLTFHYELSGTTAAAYSVYALTLYEQEAELIQKDGKLLFR